MDFFDQAAEQFTNAMYLYNDETGDNFKGDNLMDVINKLNSHDTCKKMIASFTFSLSEGANNQVRVVVSRIIDNWKPRIQNDMSRDK